MLTGLAVEQEGFHGRSNMLPVTLTY